MYNLAQIPIHMIHEVEPPWYWTCMFLGVGRCKGHCACSDTVINVSTSYVMPLYQNYLYVSIKIWWICKYLSKIEMDNQMIQIKDQLTFLGKKLLFLWTKTIQMKGNSASSKYSISLEHFSHCEGERVENGVMHNILYGLYFNVISMHWQQGRFQA